MACRVGFGALSKTVGTRLKERSKTMMMPAASLVTCKRLEWTATFQRLKKCRRRFVRLTRQRSERMPIRPENRSKYPPDWKDISARIRFDRADGRCECDGRCGEDHSGGRCAAEHGKPHPVTGSTVVLTTMHLDHDPTNCDDDNLMAGCQKCHNRYDAPKRRRGIAERRPLPLFDQKTL